MEINFQYRSASDSGDRGSNSNSGGWSRKGKGKRGGVGGGDNYQNISIIPADSIQSPVTTISNSRGGPSVSSSSSSSSSTSTSSPLSQPPPTQNRSKSSGAAKRQLRPPPGFGAQLSSGGGGDQPDAESTAVQKNGAVQTSASNDPDLQKNLQTLFNNNSTTFSEFKSLASSFKNSLLSAKEFIGYLAKLVSDGNPSSQAAEKQKASSAWDNSSEDMFYFDSDTLSLIGKVWQKLAESVPIPECGGSSQSLLTKEQRSAEMLRAWNDFKVKVRTSAATNIGQSLSSKPYGLLTTATASSSSTPTAARVLVIKSSASRHKFNNSNFRSGITNSSRINSVNWDRVADKIISREERESGRQEEEVEQQQRPSFARVGKDGFRPSLTSSDYPSLNNSSYTSSLLPIGSSSRASPPPFVHGKPNGNDFPSLRTPSSSSATALASSSTASSSVQSDFVKMGLWEVEAGASCSKDEGDSPKRGKGKQKKTKQVLFTVGMVPR